MKIKLVIELDDRCRRAIAAHVGKKGKATYEECKAHLELAINGDMEDVGFDYDKAQDEKQAS
jgi:hypothetical protein